MGKFARRILLLIVLACLLATTVSAQTSATSVNTLVTVASNGQAAVTMNVSIHLANPSSALSFPLPRGAEKVTLNGTSIRTYPSPYDANAVIADLSMYDGATGDLQLLQDLLDLTKIRMHQGHSVCIGLQPFPCCRQGNGVTVNANEPSGSQTLCDLAGMTGAT